ncbi:LysR family transcriptional regulator [Dokdonella soli]|uniref:LysR family transcriptional regulator n=1 Tax=Dokdonella soli TaxID=529810 RepID=A0ABN1IDH7_9GAMM
MIDWEDLRYFLAIARAGNLSAAARVIGTTQPTMGRRIEAFEHRLGTRLFLRTPDGFVPTASGRALLAHAARMEDEALAAERVASARDNGLSGTLRITAPEWLAARVLAPLLGPFCTLHPALTIALIGESRRFDLSRGEADIALRLARFEQQELAQRRVADFAFGLYAAPAYLERNGAPDFDAACAGHTLVTTTEDLADVADAIWLRQHAARAHIAFRSNSREAQAAAAIAGAGLACLARVHGDALAGLRFVPVPVEVPARPLWLGLHADARDTPRVRAAVDFLAGKLHRIAHAPDAVAG